jgi:hypothetical protein
VPGLDAGLLSRIEDASLNASAPPQQRWLDGWLMRFSPGKARRARSINAVADGCLPWRERLALAEAPSYGQPGVSFDPSSKGAQAYVQFAREMAARLG